VDIIVGGPPKRSRRASAVWLVIALAFGLLWGYLALGEEGERLETLYFGTSMILGGILTLTGDLLYERRRMLAQAARLAGQLSFHAGFVVFFVGLWQTGERGWLMYATFVYALLMLAWAWYVIGEYRSGSGRGAPR
jgi:hypothetical protein